MYATKFPVPDSYAQAFPTASRAKYRRVLSQSSAAPLCLFQPNSCLSQIPAALASRRILAHSCCGSQTSRLAKVVRSLGCGKLKPPKYPSPRDPDRTSRQNPLLDLYSAPRNDLAPDEACSDRVAAGKSSLPIGSCGLRAPSSTRN